MVCAPQTASAASCSVAITSPAVATLFRYSRSITTAGGTCQTLLRLGQAVDRIAPIALVDLDTPVADVPRLQPILPRMAVPQPEKPRAIQCC